MDDRATMEKIAAENLEKFRAALILAGFKVRGHEELVNGYWHWSVEVVPPWYLFFTDAGPIKIGWRKHVISVHWNWTELRWKRPVDPNVTADETLFHAWSYEKLVEYLKLLRHAFVEHAEERR